MRVLLQRVTHGAVRVDGKTLGEIGKGLVILVGVGHQDTEKDAEFLAEKAANLRIFEDPDEKMNLSLLDIGGEALVISQFTLYADARKGRRPSFTDAAAPDKADALYQHFAQVLRNLGINTPTGQFGAHMMVEIHNDGPVTILLSTDTTS